MTQEQDPASTTDGGAPEVTGTAAEPAAGKPDAGGRRVLAALFWLLASLAIMLSSVTVWAHQTLLTSNGWGQLVGEVIEEPEVIDNISTIVVTRISDSLEVSTRVADFLPGALDIVAGALTNAVEDRVIDAVAGFIGSEGFKEAFVVANELGHTAAMASIRGGDSEALTSEAGLISLNIFPIIEGVLRNLQEAGLIDADRDIPDLSGFEASPERVAMLERILGRDLPDDIGTIVLVDSERLETVQRVVRNFDLITVILSLLTLLFVGLALWLSSPRVRMVLWLAGGAIAALAVGRFFTRLTLNAASDRAQEGGAGVTVLAIIDAAVDSLMWFTFVVMAAFAVVALAAIWWERREAGERVPRQTPPRTLAQWARDNAAMLLYAAIGVIAFIVIWNTGGPDLALLTAAGLGLVGVAYKLLTGDDQAGGVDEADSEAAG